MNPRISAILQAVLVTFLWSTSWVLIKIGLRGNIPPVTFAGLRYGLASMCLFPFVIGNPRKRKALGQIPRTDWFRLILLGILLFTLTQSLMYLSLDRLPAATLSLVLNLTSVFVGFAGIIFLKEHPTLLQWTGVLVTTLGLGVYFLPVFIPDSQKIGLGFAIACMILNVIAVLFGRQINRSEKYPPLIVTFISMGVGSILMISIGGATQGFGKLTGMDWLIITWLAVVNTAVCFTIWNNTLRVLTAIESSILNSLMMPQTVLLAMIFLDEIPKTKELIGLGLVFAGIIVVQIRKSRSPTNAILHKRTDQPNNRSSNPSKEDYY